MRARWRVVWIDADEEPNEYTRHRGELLDEAGALAFARRLTAEAVVTDLYIQRLDPGARRWEDVIGPGIDGLGGAS